MTEEDEDWFHRATTEEGEENDRPAVGHGAPGDDGDEASGESTTEEPDDFAGASGDVEDGDSFEGDDRFDAGSGGDGFGGGTDGSVVGDGATDHPSDDPFGDAGGSALGGAGEGTSRGGGDSALGSGDGVFGGEDGAFGGGKESPFGSGDDTFGGGGGDFGMGDFGASSGRDTDFGDEAVDSDIERIDLGIDGLDDMIRGGVPDSSLMTVVGSAGTGKTTFGLQFLDQGLATDEKGIYITLEESRERVIRSAEEKGWSFEEYAADGQLAVVDMDPVEMANSLSSIRSELPRLVDRFGASRLVLDSVSLLEMMYDDRATRRNEIYTFARSLKESGVTILLTSEADDDNPYASRHGIVEYLTDAVYILQYVRPSDFRETRLAVEIQKIRDAHHSREMKPYEITDEGISVYQQANIF